MFHGAAPSQAHLDRGCLGVSIYLVGTPRSRSAVLEERGRHVTPARSLTLNTMFHGAAPSQAHFCRGCLGVNMYRLGIPRDRSAELKERGRLVTPARQPSRAYLCHAALIVGNPFHGAAPSQAHLGCECLGVNMYRLGIPRNRSAELKERGSLVTPAHKPSCTYVSPQL
jgi:hypothetical protein